MKKLLWRLRQNGTNLELRAPRHRSKPMWALILAGAALIGVAAVLVGNDDAGARGGGNAAQVNFTPDAAPDESSPSPSTRTDGSERAKPRGGGQAFCVRLCDGYFFPSNDAAGRDEACNDQCPDAPSAYYSAPGGSDEIENAVFDERFAICRAAGCLPIPHDGRRHLHLPSQKCELFRDAVARPNTAQGRHRHDAKGSGRLRRLQNVWCPLGRLRRSGGRAVSAEERSSRPFENAQRRSRRLVRGSLSSAVGERLCVAGSGRRSQAREKARDLGRYADRHRRPLRRNGRASTARVLVNPSKAGMKRTKRV